MASIFKPSEASDEPLKGVANINDRSQSNCKLQNRKKIIFILSGLILAAVIITVITVSTGDDVPEEVVNVPKKDVQLPYSSQSAVVRRSSDCPILPSYPGTKLQNISALGIAAFLDSSDDIPGLIKSGCDPNYAGAFLPKTTTKCSSPFLERIGVNCTREIKEAGFTPLIIATMRHSTNAVKELTAVPGINLDFASKGIAPAIWEAASNGNLDMVMTLNEGGAFLDNPGGPLNVSPLAISILMGHNAVTYYLLSQDVDVNFIGPGDSRTPVYIAAEVGNLEVLKALKKKGADLDLRVGENQATPLIIASESGHVKTVDYLISQRVHLDTQGEAGDTAILHAANNGHLQVVKSLHSAGANPNLMAINGETPLSIAILKGNTNIALFLIRNGVDLTLDDSVFNAAQKGNILVLKALNEANADLEAPGGPKDIAPIVVAALKGYLNIVDYLISQGVELNRQGNSGLTAISAAAIGGHLDVIQSLHGAGGDIDLMYMDNTPLGNAILNEHTDIALYLIRNGADLTLDNPVFNAAQEGNIPVLEALSQANADLETPGGPGKNTPLAIAALAGKEAAVKFLINQGVDKNVRNSDGYTALDFARYKGFDNIIKILERH